MDHILLMDHFHKMQKATKRDVAIQSSQANSERIYQTFCFFFLVFPPNVPLHILICNVSV